MEGLTIQGELKGCDRTMDGLFLRSLAITFRYYENLSTARKLPVILLYPVHMLEEFTDAVDVGFVYMVNYIDGFLYAEPFLHPWDEAYLIVVDDFSDMFLVRFAYILLSILALMFMRDIGL
ncbi:hypothetical protein H671_5g14376 [Cricetulus griseus]|nr:hypothetical protein H671_5g14376 [Cricetulus griseus]